jgi:hypothetical protein
MARFIGTSRMKWHGCFDDSRIPRSDARQSITIPSLKPTSAMNLPRVLVSAIALGALFTASPYRVTADAVTDWNAALASALKTSGLASNAQVRPAAIVNAAIFDSVNGIARKYEPFAMVDPAPRDASQEAAAVHAAYTTLFALFPAQKPFFDGQLATSLAALTGSSTSITTGRAWGESVARAILDWRATDGVRNQFTLFGDSQPGYWRTPTAGQSAVGVNLATMVPFTLKQPTQFRPGAPYGKVDRLTALTTAAYARDVNEVKAIGSATSTTRTAEQTEFARFWHAEDASDEIRALITIVPAHATLVDNARLFALCCLAAADAAIVCFDSKSAYSLWRPIDAIRLADTDNNSATDPDSGWTPLVATPRHPEYLSAHCIFTAATFGTAALLLGDNRTFTLQTPSFTTTTRTFTRLSAAIDEVVEARIWAGLHFRLACEEGRDTGLEIASYTVSNFLRPRHRGGHRREHDADPIR